MTNGRRSYRHPSPSAPVGILGPMNPTERQDMRGREPEEAHGLIADSAPVIVAGGQIISAKISSGKDKGDGKS